MMRAPIPFWWVPHAERAVCRRKFLSVAAGTVGGALGAGLLWPTRARADDDDDDDDETVMPRPIPGGTLLVFGNEQFFIHHFAPASGSEPSEITDLNGLVGLNRIFGTGTGTDTQTGDQQRLVFRVDNGFMQGLYVGEDGRRHHATFAFI
jgi:hypothetical protein